MSGDVLSNGEIRTFNAEKHGYKARAKRQEEEEFQRFRDNCPSKRWGLCWASRGDLPSCNPDMISSCPLWYAAKWGK